MWSVLKTVYIQFVCNISVNNAIDTASALRGKLVITFFGSTQIEPVNTPQGFYFSKPFESVMRWMSFQRQEFQLHRLVVLSLRQYWCKLIKTVSVIFRMTKLPDFSPVSRSGILFMPLIPSQLFMSSSISSLTVAATKLLALSLTPTSQQYLNHQPLLLHTRVRLVETLVRLVKTLGVPYCHLRVFV